MENSSKEVKVIKTLPGDFVNRCTFDPVIGQYITCQSYEDITNKMFTGEDLYILDLKTGHIEPVIPGGEKRKWAIRCHIKEAINKANTVLASVSSSRDKRLDCKKNVDELEFAI